MEPKLLNYFDNEINAQEVKTKLAEADIECVLQYETKTSINVMAESSEECVAVYVDKNDYTKAKSILDDYEQQLEERLSWCPICGSEDVTITNINEHYKPKWLYIVFAVLFVLFIVLSILSTAMFMFPLFFILAFIVLLNGHKKKAYHCNKCGNDF